MGADSKTNFNTNQGKSGKSSVKPRILVAPLDWGLGHATRCIPIINRLRDQGIEVWIGADGAVETLLKKEFPDLHFLTLPGYKVKYAGSGGWFAWKIIRQLPKIRKAIRYENKWLQEQVERFGFDAVIADNRFGLYHAVIPCIFITHQLAIQSPLSWAEKIIRRWNYRYINRFTTCWVPDWAGHINLAGALSHPAIVPAIPLHYIGLLSRLSSQSATEKQAYLLILLSGPEPQRSIFENILIDQLVHYRGTADIIRGLPGEANILPSTNSIRFYNHLPAEELSKKMNEATYIISRSGYSTVMDLVQLQKKSILIPTPGQTEQEYLAAHLMKNKIACCIGQAQFSLKEALMQAEKFSYQFPVNTENGLEKTITAFVNGLVAENRTES